VSGDDLSTQERLILALTPNREAAAQFYQLVRNPVGFVLTVIVAQFLGLGSYIVGSVLAVFDFLIIRILRPAQLLIIDVLSFISSSNVVLYVAVLADKGVERAADYYRNR